MAVKYHPGQVVLIHFPYSDLSQKKLRPGIILLGAGSNAYLVAAVTSQERRKTEGALALGPADLSAGRLKYSSYIRPDVLFTAHQKVIGHVIGTITHEKHAQLAGAICKSVQEAIPGKK